MSQETITSPSQEDAIALAGVRKTFGSNVAVENLDLVVPRGSLYGFIGPNGAGKTTTIRMIMSILFPDQGELRVLGQASALDAKDRIGYLPEERGVYRKMKVGRFLRYIGHLKGMGGIELHREVDQWLERVGLSEVVGKPCEELSKGMQQKVQFSSAVLHRPDLVILDEPFSGLDPVNMRLLRDLIREEHQRGTTIIFSTHVMHQAEELCDHIVMIHNGRKMLDDNLQQIQQRHDPRLIHLEPLDPEAATSVVDGLEGVSAVKEERPGAWQVHLAEGADPHGVLRALVSAVPPQRVELHRPTLEDVFVEIVSRSDDRSEREVRDALQGVEDEGVAA